MKLSQSAKLKARELHQSTNHKYDLGDYFETHIQMVVYFGLQYIYLIPVEDREAVIAALYLHDSIEDCRVTHSDLKKWFGQMVADIVYAVTNEKGRVRKERANDVYYTGIRRTKYATFVKLVDRMANVNYSQTKGSTMFTKYKDEQPNFEKSLKGTQFLLGKVDYWFDSIFNLRGIDYSILYEDLNKMYDNVPSSFEIAYNEE